MNLSCHFHINCLADVWTHQFYQVYILCIAFWLWDPCLCLYCQRGLIMWHSFGRGKYFQEKFVILLSPIEVLRLVNNMSIKLSLIINKNLLCDLHINCLADVWTHQFYQVYILLIAYNMGQFHWGIFWSFIRDISCWLGHLVWERQCCSALDWVSDGKSLLATFPSSVLETKFSRHMYSCVCSLLVLWIFWIFEWSWECKSDVIWLLRWLLLKFFWRFNSSGFNVAMT